MNFGIIIAIALAIYAYVQQSGSGDSADPSSPTDSIFPAAVDALTGVGGAGEILSVEAPTALDSITQIFQGVSDTVSGALGIGLDSVVSVIADVISAREGFDPTGKSHNRPTRDNNPGDLEEVGDAGRDGLFAIFSSPAAGRAALESDIRAKIRKYPDFSIYDMIARYAPPSENDTTSYANAVASALGVPVTTKLSQLG